MIKFSGHMQKFIVANLILIFFAYGCDNIDQSDGNAAVSTYCQYEFGHASRAKIKDLFHSRTDVFGCAIDGSSRQLLFAPQINHGCENITDVDLSIISYADAGNKTRSCSPISNTETERTGIVVIYGLGDDRNDVRQKLLKFVTAGGDGIVYYMSQDDYYCFEIADDSFVDDIDEYMGSNFRVNTTYRGNGNCRQLAMREMGVNFSYR